MQLFKLLDYLGDNLKVSFAFQLIFGNSAGATEWPEARGRIVFLGYFFDNKKVTKD